MNHWLISQPPEEKTEDSAAGKFVASSLLFSTAAKASGRRDSIYFTSPSTQSSFIFWSRRWKWKEDVERVSSWIYWKPHEQEEIWRGRRCHRCFFPFPAPLMAHVQVKRPSPMCCKDRWIHFHTIHPLSRCNLSPTLEITEEKVFAFWLITLISIAPPLSRWNCTSLTRRRGIGLKEVWQI